MTILRQYNPAHFTISGQVLSLAEGVLSSGDFTRSFSFGGGAHDYTLDAQWNDTLYPDTSDATMSGPLGDGTNVPVFYALAKSVFATNGMTRTAGGKLRITHNGSNSGAAFPAANASPSILIRMPVAQILTVQFTLTMENFVQFERVRAGVCRRSYTDGAQPSSFADVSWTPSSATVASEDIRLWDNNYAATTDLTSFISSNVCTRTYKFDMRGPNIAAYGSPSSGSTTPSTHLHGRSSALVGGMGDLAFFLSLGTASTPEAGYYAEIGGLSVSGTRTIL